ncbi:MAG TPA: hypothetical protein VK887_13875 [Pseudonocardiaceae bacterium]|nr:hypothetical protein [Pseudonocardiaceae bacterium]
MGATDRVWSTGSRLQRREENTSGPGLTGRHGRRDRIQRTQYNPSSTKERTMLVLELTHVVRQRNKREAAANAERAMPAPA